MSKPTRAWKNPSVSSYAIETLYTEVERVFVILQDTTRVLLYFHAAIFVRGDHFTFTKWARKKRRSLSTEHVSIVFSLIDTPTVLTAQAHECSTLVVSFATVSERFPHPLVVQSNLSRFRAGAAGATRDAWLFENPCFTIVQSRKKDCQQTLALPDFSSGTLL